MDAREQLRRYLEQRREMGERELILDGMSVEDVMRIVGAAGTVSKDAPPVQRRAVDPGEPAATPIARSEQRASESSDWREILRAAGGAPQRTTNVAKPAPVPPVTPAAPPAPPAPEEFDDGDAPEDAVASPPAYVMRPTPQAMPRVQPTPAPAGDPPAGIVVGTASRELFGG